MVQWQIDLFLSITSPKAAKEMHLYLTDFKGYTMDMIDIYDAAQNWNGIFKLLKNLKSSKATGPDSIPAFILKEAAQEMAPILTLIFHGRLIQESFQDNGGKHGLYPYIRREINTYWETTDQYP